MSLAAYARNLYAPTKLVDVSVVSIVVTAAGRDAARSAPDTTVGAPSSGVYACTMPSGVGQILLGVETVNDAAIKAQVTGLTSANGVASFNLTHADGTSFAGTEEAHVTFLVFNQ